MQPERDERHYVLYKCKSCGLAEARLKEKP